MEQINDLFSVIESELNVKRSDVTSKCRKREYVEARCIGIHVLRVCSDLRTTQIGEIFGLNHTAVSYHTKGVRNLIAKQPGFDKIAKTIKNKFIAKTAIRDTRIIIMISKKFKCEKFDKKIN